MLLTASTVVYIGLLMSWCVCEKKVVKGKREHEQKTSSVAKPAKEKHEKNGKRWMGGFAQNFVPPDADLGGSDFGGGAPPMQYGPQFTQTPEPFNTINADSLSYGFGNGFKEPAMVNQIATQIQPAMKDPSLQGLDDLKLPKNSYGNGEFPLGNFASEVASYLKPGIGDYPSDMPAGMNGMTAVGMPVQMKPKPARIVGGIQPSLMQTTIEDTELTPGNFHKNPSVLNQASTSLSQGATNIDTPELLVNEPPAKLLSNTQPSAQTEEDNATVPVAIAEPEPKIEKEESSKEAADASPSADEKIVDKVAAEVTEKPEKPPKAEPERVAEDPVKTESKEDSKIEAKLESKPDSNVEAKLETSKVESKDEAKEENKGAKDIEKDVKTTTETSAEKGKPEEKQVEKDTEKENPKPAAAKDENKETKIEGKDKPIKSKQVAAAADPDESTKASKMDNKEKPEPPAAEAEGPLKLIKSKQKPVTGARRQNWDHILDTGHNRLEPVGLPEGATVSFENPADDSGGEDGGDSAIAATIETGDEEDDTTPSNAMKNKLVTNIKEALLQNSNMLATKENEKEDDETPEEIQNELEMKGSSNEDEEADANDVNENESTAESSKPDLLEENLMKIDKKKLVHLLANMMRKNRDKEIESENEESEENESVTASSGSSPKEALKKGNGEEKEEDSSKLKEKEKEKEKGKLSLSEEQDQGDYQPKIAKVKHQQKAGSRHTQYDPYTQIGLTDPAISQSERSGKHGHIKNKDKEEKDDEEKEKEKKISELLKLKVKQNAQKEEKEGNEDKEGLKAAVNEGSKLTEKTESKESEKEDSSVSEKEDTKAVEAVIKDAEQSVDEEKIREKLKELKEKEKEKEEDKAEAEEVQVEAQVEKERQELKKLKEEEKQEKERESKLKAENAQLLADKQNSNEEEKENDDNVEVDDSVKEQGKLKKQQQKIFHLVSPALVSAIAENIQLHHGDKDKDDDDNEETQGVDDTNVNHSSKEKSKETDKSTQELINEKVKAKLKDESSNKKVDSSDSANIQNLINHMKEIKLNSVKPIKQLLKQGLKEKDLKLKHRKGYFEEAYSQIGSSDPNVKKRKTITSLHNRSKITPKHHLHNRSKVAKHQ